MSSDTLSTKTITSLMPLINLLSDGKTHSGEVLGGLLGVSRTAVWKQLKKLNSLGLTVQSVKGAGYCLSEPIDLLDQEGIAAGLKAGLEVPVALEVKPCVDSSNSYVSRYLREQSTGQDSLLVCATEMQTAGRGRRGRSWVSPFASNLYFSVGIKAPQSLGSYQGLSLAVGVEIVAALKELFPGFSANLKWPNDILVGGKKLSGILIEVDGDLSGNCNLVVGVGVNYRMPESSSEAIDQAWIDLASVLSHMNVAPSNRSEVLLALVKRLVSVIVEFPNKGFDAYRERWQALDVFYGRAVTVTTGGSSAEGVSQGVDASGALLVDIEGDVKVFSGGEVTLRGGQ